MACVGVDESMAETTDLEDALPVHHLGKMSCTRAKVVGDPSTKHRSPAYG